MATIKLQFNPSLPAWRAPRVTGTQRGLISFIDTRLEQMYIISKTAAVKRLNAIRSSLLRYTSGKEIAWKNVDETFILGYEAHLMTRGLCRNSTSYYMRNLRAVINLAIDNGVRLPRDLFRHVYTGVDKTSKRAVSLDTIKQIRDLDLDCYPSLNFARNIFMFAFYTRGMSFVDIAYLKKTDVTNGVILYSRRKTRQRLAVKIEPEAQQIIERLGPSTSPYLLPIIQNPSTNPQRQYEQAYYRINRNIRKVGQMVGLKSKLTLYVARHTWASIAQANNVAIATISKAMGHDSEKTTRIYLQSLDTAAVDKANSDIISLLDRD